MKKSPIIGSRHEQFVHEYEVCNEDDVTLESITLVISRRFHARGEKRGEPHTKLAQLVLQHYDLETQKPSRILAADLGKGDFDRIQEMIDDEEEEIRFDGSKLTLEQAIANQFGDPSLPYAELVIPLLDYRRYAAFFLRGLVLISAIESDYLAKECAYDQDAAAEGLDA